MKRMFDPNGSSWVCMTGLLPSRSASNGPRFSPELLLMLDIEPSIHRWW